VVLLGALLALVLVSAFGGMEAARRAKGLEQGIATRESYALRRAKLALLGYASSYAEQHDSGPARNAVNAIGPGFLPCPDVDGDGSPDPACPRGASGGLPWRRLGLVPSGIGYELADPYRSNPRKYVPLNTDTAVEPGAGGASGAVAMLRLVRPAMAGAAAGGAFARRRTALLDRAEMARYLEARVGMEVVHVLERYRQAPANGGVLPWLKPWAAPAGAFRRPGIRSGSLAVHHPGFFHSGFRITLREFASSGRRRDSGGLAGGRELVVTVEDAAGRCYWQAAWRFTCEGIGDAAGRGAGLAAASRVRVAFDLRTARVRIVPATVNSARMRAFANRGRLAPGEEIVLESVSGGRGSGAGQESSPLSVRGVRLGAGDEVEVAVTGVRLDLVPGVEVPWWYVLHDWERHVYVELSEASGPGGAGRCTPVGRECLHWGSGEARRPVAARIWMAGPALPGQRRYPAGLTSIFAYFEGEAILPPVFSAGARVLRGAKNDRVQVLGLRSSSHRPVQGSTVP